MASTAGPCKRKKLGHRWSRGGETSQLSTHHPPQTHATPPVAFPDALTHHSTPNAVTRAGCPMSWGTVTGWTSLKEKKKKLRPSSPVRHACTAAHRSMQNYPSQHVCQLITLCGMGWHLAGARTHAPVAPQSATLSISKLSRHPFGPASQIKHW
jgi:hypothetical protein